MQITTAVFIKIVLPFKDKEIEIESTFDKLVTFRSNDVQVFSIINKEPGSTILLKAQIFVKGIELSSAVIIALSIKVNNKCVA